MLSTKTIDLDGEEFLDAGAGVDAAGMLVMLRAVPGVRVRRRIGPTDQDGEIAKVHEAADRDAGAGPVLHRLHAGLEVEAHRLVRRQGLEQRCLADAGRSEDRERGLVLAAERRSSAVTIANWHLFAPNGRRGVDRAPKDGPVRARATDHPAVGLSGSKWLDAIGRTTGLDGARRNEEFSDRAGPVREGGLRHVELRLHVVGWIIAPAGADDVDRVCAASPGPISRVWAGRRSP